MLTMFVITLLRKALNPWAWFKTRYRESMMTNNFCCKTRIICYKASYLLCEKFEWQCMTDLFISEVRDDRLGFFAIRSYPVSEKWYPYQIQILFWLKSYYVYPVPLPRGAFGVLAPQTKLQAPQIETWNTINQLRFCQFLECQASPNTPKAPLWKTFLATVLSASVNYPKVYYHAQHTFVCCVYFASWG